MRTERWPWWLRAAVVYGAVVPLLGLGNLTGGDDGPLAGKIAAFVVAVLVGVVIISGVRLRLVGRRRVGSGLTAAGVAPACLLVMFFWFPPVAALGLLAMVVTVKATSDALDAAHAR